MVVARLSRVLDGAARIDGAARAVAARKLTVRKDVNSIVKKYKQKKIFDANE
jgi:hypothetical protein